MRHRRLADIDLLDKLTHRQRPTSHRQPIQQQHATDRPNSETTTPTPLPNHGRPSSIIDDSRWTRRCSKRNVSGRGAVAWTCWREEGKPARELRPRELLTPPHAGRAEPGEADAFVRPWLMRRPGFYRSFYRVSNVAAGTEDIDEGLRRAERQPLVRRHLRGTRPGHATREAQLACPGHEPCECGTACGASGKATQRARTTKSAT